MRVLVVDDDPALREALVVALELAGNEAHGAGSKAEALDVLDSGIEPDAFVLDLGLPDADGGDLGGELRSSRAGALPRIVGISGDEDRLQTLLEEGVIDEALAKPFRVIELCMAVSGHSRSA